MGKRKKISIKNLESIICVSRNNGSNWTNYIIFGFSDVGMFDRASKFVIEMLSQLISSCVLSTGEKKKRRIERLPTVFSIIRLLCVCWMPMSSSSRRRGRQISSGDPKKLIQKIHLINKAVEIVEWQTFSFASCIFHSTLAPPNIWFRYVCSHFKNSRGVLRHHITFTRGTLDEPHMPETSLLNRLST